VLLLLALLVLPQVALLVMTEQCPLALGGGSGAYWRGCTPTRAWLPTVVVVIAVGVATLGILWWGFAEVDGGAKRRWGRRGRSRIDTRLLGDDSGRDGVDADTSAGGAAVAVVPLAAGSGGSGGASATTVSLAAGGCPRDGNGTARGLGGAVTGGGTAAGARDTLRTPKLDAASVGADAAAAVAASSQAGALARRSAGVVSVRAARIRRFGEMGEIGSPAFNDAGGSAHASEEEEVVAALFASAARIVLPINSTTCAVGTAGGHAMQ